MVNPLLRPLWGALFISNLVVGAAGGGLIETWGLLERGHLLNLEKMKVSVLQKKKLEYKVEMLKYRKLEVMQLRIKDKSELLVGK